LSKEKGGRAKKTEGYVDLEKMKDHSLHGEVLKVNMPATRDVQ